MSSFAFSFGQVDDPNPEEAALCLGLASALLRDRQYKLGAEMLGHAMNLLEPQSLQDIMRRMYGNISEEIYGAFKVGDWKYTKPSQSRNTFNFRTPK